jgi:amino acid adenylation domain-containing protein
MHQVLAGGLPLYNETVVIRYQGEVDVPALKASLRELSQRHEILRTTIHEEDGAPYQQIEDTNAVEVDFLDISSRAEEKRTQEADRLLHECATRPFDLSRGPLLRALALRFGSSDVRIFLTLHHLIFDGISLRRILLPELIELYKAFSEGHSPVLLPAGLRYVDYASAQQASSPAGRQADLAFWKARLADFSHLSLPLDRPRTPQTGYQGDLYSFAFPPELCSLVAAFARQEKTSIFNILLSSFVLLLARYADTVDVAMGTIHGGRAVAELENAVGCFVNTLVLRTDLSEDPSFHDVLARVREVTLQALEHAELPFQEVARECLNRAGIGDAPVQVVFAFQPPYPDLPAGWDIDVFAASNGTSRSDLQVEVEERHGELRARMLYNTDLFDAATIEAMQQHWLKLLSEALGQPLLSIWKLPLLSPAEQLWRRDTLNNSERETPQVCVHELFVRMAHAEPDRIAVSFQGRSFTYAQLESLSASLAHRLVQSGFGPGAVIGLMAERSPVMLAALLGILRAGATYVPMDPTYPTARLEHMLRASGASLLLTEDALLSRLPDAAISVLSIQDGVRASQDERTDWLPLPSVPLSSLAYIIFTSGSTGIPKGVEISHGALTNLLCSMQQTPGIEADDVLLAVTSICFDIAAVELFLPLLAGARIEIASTQEAADPMLLASRIGQSRATIVQATPISWRMLVESGWTGAPNLKILCGGEALPELLALQLQDRSAAVWNMYGPTETTIWSACAEIPKDFSHITLGTPVANTTLYVLDSHQRLVPAGVVGELYIGGAGLATGYRGQPELTRKRFCSVRFEGGEVTRLYRTGDRVKRLRDGSLLFLDRTDRQVKIAGFRIELGEIEHVLNSLPGVQESAVIKTQLAAGGEILAGFVLPKAGHTVSEQELRTGLQSFLPTYMRPARLRVLTEVPLTLNGKLDRSRLFELVADDEVSAGGEPRAGTEQKLADIWCDLLKVGSVDRDDNFFHLGGHSLLAARFIAQARRVFGQPFTLSSFIQAPTITQFALVVEGCAAPLSHLVKRGSGHTQLLWIGADPWLMRLARHLSPDLTLYTIMPDPDCYMGATSPCTIEALATRLVASVRQTQARGPYMLGGFCLQGLLALEVAQQLERAGEQISLLVLTDLYSVAGLPGRGKLERLRARIRRERFHLSRMNQMRANEWASYLSTRWKGTRHRRRSLKTLDEPPRDLQQVLYVAEMLYKSSTYSGKVLFLESDEGRLSHPSTSSSWSGLLTNIEVIQYAGDHMAMLKEPQLSIAANAIQKAIENNSSWSLAGTL